MADRYIELAESPLAPGTSPVRIHYRDVGAGAPLMVLHGGWGYDIYPFDRQIAALAASRRIVIPDRSGYGASGRLITQEIDFHRRAAEETFAVIDALALDRPILWGHSDGAVIALLMGLAAPERVGGLILEATHLFRRKPASRPFFELMRDNPEGLGERVTGVLAREHGDAVEASDLDKRRRVAAPRRTGRRPVRRPVVGIAGARPGHSRRPRSAHGAG